MIHPNGKNHQRRTIVAIIACLCFLLAGLPSAALATGGGDGGGGRDNSDSFAEEMKRLKEDYGQKPKPGNGGDDPPFDPLSAILVPPNFTDTPNIDCEPIVGYDPTSTNSVGPSDIVVLDENFTDEQVAMVVLTSGFAGSIIATAPFVGFISIPWYGALAVGAARSPATPEILDFWQKEMGWK